MEPKPVLVRPESGAGDAVVTGLGDPSITLVENGPALGILLAEGCHEAGYGGRLFLNRVTWARGDETVRALRDFARVCLYQAGKGAWVGEEVETGRLFPRPSYLPYHVLFLPGAEYQNLMALRAEGNAAAILTYARERFGQLSGFHLHEERLVAPEGYAAAGEEMMAGSSYVEGS
jgi:hypothetical protein